ncbi:MAG: hypothetical protein ACRDHL_06165, partial [Candidatus Promineifilaceae bacterium]
MGPLGRALFGALLLSLSLAACAGADGRLAGDASGGFLAAPAPAGAEPAAVMLAELSAAPADYAGQLVEVSGRLVKLPAPSCAGKALPAPGAWALIEGEADVQVRGLPAAFAAAAEGGQGVTLAGRWLGWEGPVGCGRSALRQHVWLLVLERVVAPNPIALAPAGTGGRGAGPPPGPTATRLTEAQDVSPTPLATPARPAGAPPLPDESPIPAATPVTYP